ncbi:hypothetical protein B0H14DRAFT_2619689 [Mycena olivaceomarginata]|nr:hypothetical protein B0H14DRAFT_2619689 [Mycena olivaceomarginata]
MCTAVSAQKLYCGIGENKREEDLGVYSSTPRWQPKKFAGDPCSIQGQVISGDPRSNRGQVMVIFWEVFSPARGSGQMVIFAQLVTRLQCGEVFVLTLKPGNKAGQYKSKKTW